MTEEQLWSGSPRSRALAWSLAGIAVLGFAGLVLLKATYDGWSALEPDLALTVMLVLGYAGLGTLLALRQPANLIGWLFTAGGLTWLLDEAARSYAKHAMADGQGTSVAARLGAAFDVNFWPIAVACSFGVPLLLFPAGRPKSARWRWVLAAMVTGGLTTLAASAVSTSPLASPLDASVSVVNPWGVDRLATVSAVAVPVGVLIFLVTLVAAVLGIAVRFRSAAGVERQQLRWVLTGAVLTIVDGLYLASGLLGVSTRFAGVAVGFGIGSLPLYFTVAILRYRLYDLDRIVSRTVTYGAVTGVLVATYVGLVTTVSRLTPSSSSLAVAASTLAVAALFQPLRQRVQRAVDHRFNRSRFDAERTVAAFRLRLREEVDLDQVRTDLLAVVRDTLQPATTSLWLRPAPGTAR